MGLAQTIFAPHTSFLAHTLATASEAAIKEITLLNGTLVRLLDIGVIEFIPARSGQGGLLLSSGVHGNETAPIELIDQLVTDSLNETVTLTRPVLLIMGHPEAMRQSTRFIEYNMNRLFNGTHAKEPFVGSVDSQRAEQLEQFVEAFHQQHGVTEHYDLHTAIRDSFVERFALKPFVSEKDALTVSEHARITLEGFGTTALVYQHKKASTFSAHTAQRFGCESFTVELGKVRSFGENDLEHYANSYQTLKALVSNKEIIPNGKALDEYKVCHELIIDDEQYELFVDDQVANFTAFERGYKMSESPVSKYEVLHEKEYLIFPNANVPIGQRAGLMLERINRGQAK